MPLIPLNHHYAMENPASVYDEEAMTALELAGRTTAKVNEAVRAFNTLETETNNHLNEQDTDIAKKFKTMTEETIPQTVKADVLAHINNGDFDKAINTYLKYLNERVDNLLGQVTTGTTSMDAEVIDGRTQHNGEVSTNLGNAIRSQYGDLLARLGTPAIEWTEGYYVNTSGGLYTLASTAVTDYLPILPGARYKVKTIMGENMCVAFYNSVRGFISAFDGDADNYAKNVWVEYELDIPEGCCYVRFTCRNSRRDEASLTCLDILGAVHLLNDTMVKRTTVELEPREIINGAYAMTNGKLVTYETVDVLVYDVSKINGYTVTMETVFIDSAKGHFLNEYGECVGGIEALTAQVPTGAHTMRISNYTAQKVTDTVLVYYDMNEVTETKDTPKNYTIGMGPTLCIGDSLTSGACYYDKRFNGSSIDQNYPRYLAKLIQNDVTNGGRSGYSASDWWNKLAGTYDYTKYDTFVIWLGTNNGLTDTLAEDVNAHGNYADFANTETGYYCKIISQIKAVNPDAFIVLCNVFASKGSVTTTNKVIQQIAEKYGCPVVDMTEMGTANHPELHGGISNVHFGKAGNIYLANHIRDAVNDYFNGKPLALEYGLTARTN